jgi:hypothetical protein
LHAFDLRTQQRKYNSRHDSDSDTKLTHTCELFIEA